MHQTQWQKDLLKKYGQVVLMDATYKTTKYSLPLFFIVVKTNINYKVVASFIIQDECTKTIREALQKVKSWNPEWKPSIFMTDFDEQEIVAAEDCFPGARVFLCDFHREQAWERWVSTVDNGVSTEREDVLARLRRVAHSQTESEYDKELESLKSSPVWTNNPKLQKWLSSKWLPEFKRWVLAFRPAEYLLGIHTNNGIERQHRSFKNEHIYGNRGNTLSSMVTSLVEEFLPQAYLKYVEDNLKSSSMFRKYNPDIPSYLCDRPASFIKHCLEKLCLAENISSSQISCNSLEEGNFSLTSEVTKAVYQLKFGGQFPSCSCPDWRRTFMPCKHMFAVLKGNFNWTWDKLPKEYTESPHFTLDLVGLGRSRPMSPEGIPVKKSPSRDVPVVVQAVQDVPVIVDNLPKRKVASRALGAQCRETLKKISSMSFLIPDAAPLERLLTSLQAELKVLIEAAPKDCGLLMESLKKTIRKRVNLKKNTSRLPAPKKKKHPYSGRVGKKPIE